MMVVMMVVMMMAMMVAMQVREYQKIGVTKKAKGFGPGAKVDKVSTSTCMVCLKPPSTYNQVGVLVTANYKSCQTKKSLYIVALYFVLSLAPG